MKRFSFSWLLAVLMVSSAVTTARAFTAADADALMQAHARAFYRVDSGRAWFLEKTGETNKVSFWMRAEQMEMVLDAYERTTNFEYLTMFTNLYQGFVADHGTNWGHNEFNDDIMWMVIACARANLLTGSAGFRDAARTNFDLCYARAISQDLGGGLFWKTNNQSKNACVNGPAAIAAALLSRACREPAYAEKAGSLFLWERATLFDSATGRVADNIHINGKVDRKSFSYNQGTFIGAANLLGYTNEARLAGQFMMNQLSRDGLLPGFGESGDGGGFNGIGVRWLARYMYERGEQATFESWLQKNADAAWRVRREADQLSWCRWNEPTAPGTRYSWGCSSSVVILQVVHPSEPPKAGQ